MSESRDPAIKLFGKTIPLPSGGEVVAVSGEEGGGEDDKGLSNNESPHESKDKEQEAPPKREEKRDEPISSMAIEIPKPSSSDDDDNQETAAEKNSNPEEEQNNESNNPQEKPLKKPDKILHCPRCNSLETKFCYYNNYNVNQPRHFCKNCQRYWTAGGTMRNVPVGAGRRKNKNSATSHCRHLTISDATLQTIRLSDIPDQIHNPHQLKPSGTVLSFGSDAPLCESMASVLSLAEKTIKNCNRNGFHRMEEQLEEQSSGSSVTVSNSNEDGTGANWQEPMLRNCQGFGPQIPYLNGSPWPYPWPPAPAFHIPFYPAAPAYWGCAVPGTWTLPWVTQPASCPTANGSSGSGPNSPTLGKHAREGTALNQSNSENGETPKKSNQERSIWIPKTLRIDDPEEAARSSIWTTMGFKHDKSGGISSGGGLFKSFETKGEHKNHHSTGASHVLHANPAAFSRSLNFQESS